MRVVFVKVRLGWPRTYGHDVHCYEMMRGLTALGHDVALATHHAPAPDALDGLSLGHVWVLDDSPGTAPVALSYLQERYRSYWGISHGRIADLARRTAEWNADAVVVVGLEILPYLAAAGTALKVWYAADEWVWHYVSQLRSDPGGAAEHLRHAAIKGLYERAYAGLMDRVWVVSPTERRAMRLMTGCRGVDVIANGVDADAFAPDDTVPTPNSAVFWGRLGFGPNLQALRWFLGRVWPIVRRQIPEATFAIVGADPPDEVHEWHGREGVTVIANPTDIRPEVTRRAIAVLPFVSGGGIKNKFLEGAAMARPIVASERATRGLNSRPPALFAGSPEAFARALVSLWSDPQKSATIGAEARAWVIANHSWRAAAELASRSLAAGRQD